MPPIRDPLVLSLLILAPAIGVVAQEPGPTLHIVRTSRPPELQDFVSGAASPDRTDNSGAVAVNDFRQRDPGDGNPASAPTTAYVTYDDANLYVVFVCKDAPTLVRAALAKREETTADDAVAVYLDTFRDRKHAYLFLSNPLGVQADALVTEGQDDDYSFDGVWQADGRLTPDGYVVRFAIPFRNLRFPRAPAQTWGIALVRYIRRNNEESYWPYLTKRIAGLVPQFATLDGLGDISPGRNLQAIPYGAFTGARFLDMETPAFRTASDRRVGLDFKGVIRDALTLDATVNPDFSQVESDEPQVTINERFEVFFPEKRPFFIENAGYFQTPVNLFFSRRIADPGAGLRLTGKAGPWAVGAIGIDDRAPGQAVASEQARIGAVRLEREVGHESTVGMLASDRTLAGGANHVVSADTRLTLTKTWIFTGQAMATHTRDTSGAGSSGSGWYANLLHDGRNLDYSGTYLDLSPSFETQLGYVKRVGIREFEQVLELVRRPKGPVVKVGPTFTTLFDWDRDGRLLDRSLEASFELKLRGETKVVLGREQAFELFADHPFDTYLTKLTLESEWLKWLAGTAKLRLGTAVDHKPPKGTAPYLGDAAKGELGLTFRPAPRLRLDHTFLYERLTTRPDASPPGAPLSPTRVFTDRILREKLNYQFTRALSLRAIVDYAMVNRDSTLSRVDRQHRWGVDLLLTYLVNPGTALYVGYQDGYENLAILPGSPPALYRTDDPTTSVGRQVFLKFSYLLQF